MSHAPHDPPAHDCFHLHGESTDKDRPTLDGIFNAGAEARRHGTPPHDNPYAAGSEEREEWAAGWNATPDLDLDNDGPNAPL